MLCPLQVEAALEVRLLLLRNIHLCIPLDSTWTSCMAVLALKYPKAYVNLGLG